MLVSDVQAAMFSSRRLSALDRKSSAGYSFNLSERKSSYLSAATLPFYRAESEKNIFNKTENICHKGLKLRKECDIVCFQFFI